MSNAQTDKLYEIEGKVETLQKILDKEFIDAMIRYLIEYDETVIVTERNES